MIYEYKHEKSGEVIEKEFSIHDEIPMIVKEGGKEYRRIFGNQSIHIPFQWGDIDKKADFSKSPSRRKHYW